MVQSPNDTMKYTLPLAVLLHSGTYYLPDALRFTALDSGTEKFPAVYDAAPGAPPVISGDNLRLWHDKPAAQWNECRRFLTGQTQQHHHPGG